MSASSIQERFELDVYGKRGITLVRGEGALLWDDRGREYIDCIGGHGAANLGHGHPRVLAAIESQSKRLISCPGAFYNDARARLLALLVEIAPHGLNRAFLCNSGTEAVEAALKFARIATGRSRIVAMKGGFHGRTFGAMSATFNPKYAQGSAPLVPDFHHVRYNDNEALTEAVDRRTAAVILEIVQGEGGVRIADPDFLSLARRLCDRHQALLIVDEVQTGFARTGKMFACQRFDLNPDILCLAKSIAGGLPMGAVLVNEKIDVPIGRHGSTFGGGPLVCAVAEAVIREILETDLAGRSDRAGRQWVRQLAQRNLPAVREIRNLGLMIGIELKHRVKPLLGALAESGVLALAAGANVLRLLPPLVIDDAQLASVAEKVSALLAGPVSADEDLEDLVGQ